MWRALRADLNYFRPWWLGGLGLGAGVAALVTVIFRLAESDAPPHAEAGLRAFFVLIAPLNVGFIVQTYRTDERRARLLLAGPLTPAQLGWISALLSVALLLIGAVAAGLVLAGEFALTGALEVETVNLVAYAAGLLVMMLMVALLIQEAIAASRQKRARAAAAGWAGSVVAALLLAALATAAFLTPGSLTWPSLHLGNLLVATAAAAGSVALYVRRTDFTT